MLHTPLRCVKWHPEVLLLHQLYLRNGQINAHVGVEGDGELVAVRTADSAFELAMHEVYDEGLVSF